MKLPKGTFKGLARVTAPLWFWMAAGWAAYPYIIKRIMDTVGESIDMEEVNPFSHIMMATCIGLGVALAIYGYSGKDAPDASIVSLAKRESLCPYCGKVLPMKAEECPSCKNRMPIL